MLITLVAVKSQRMKFLTVYFCYSTLILKFYNNNPEAVILQNIFTFMYINRKIIITGI
jgi:hypothetical protein